MVDIDDFKAFNDTRGHLAGNVALRRVAAALKRAVRDTDDVARYGGEEFAILLPNTPKLGALKAAEKVCRAVEKARVGEGSAPHEKPLTVSIGLASLPGDAGKRRGAHRASRPGALHRQERGQELRPALLRRAAGVLPPRRHPLGPLQPGRVRTATTSRR